MNDVGLTPWVMPKVMASAMAAIWTPANIWFTAFMADPAPASSPNGKTVSAMLSMTSFAPSNASSLPEAMTESAPFAAFTAPPEIGASK